MGLEGLFLPSSSPSKLASFSSSASSPFRCWRLSNCSLPAHSFNMEIPAATEIFRRPSAHPPTAALFRPSLHLIRQINQMTHDFDDIPQASTCPSVNGTRKRPSSTSKRRNLRPPSTRSSSTRPTLCDRPADTPKRNDTTARQFDFVQRLVLLHDHINFDLYAKLES